MANLNREQIENELCRKAEAMGTELPYDDTTITPEAMVESFIYHLEDLYGEVPQFEAEPEQFWYVAWRAYVTSVTNGMY